MSKHEKLSPYPEGLNMKIIFTGLLFLLLTNVAWAEIPNPQSNSRFVHDYTQTLSGSEKEELEKSLRLLSNRKNSIQFVIVIIPSLNGSDILTYSQDLFMKWGIGHKGIDRGLLLLLAKNDRKIRMHTGYGMESFLPDSETKKILVAIIPDLKNEKYFEAFKTSIKYVIENQKKYD